MIISLTQIRRVSVWFEEQNMTLLLFKLSCLVCSFWPFCCFVCFY